MSAEIGTLRQKTAVLTREGGREVGAISKEKFISSHFFFEKVPTSRPPSLVKTAVRYCKAPIATCIQPFLRAQNK